MGFLSGLRGISAQGALPNAEARLATLLADRAAGKSVSDADIRSASNEVTRLKLIVAEREQDLADEEREAH